MQLYKRSHGEEQPYWPAGPFKIRLPFVHYRFEASEAIQALIMFVVSLGMIPLLETHLGLPYDIALAYVVIGGAGFLLPALLGVPLVPGWITAGIPIVVVYLSGFEPGPEAIKALVALQLEVFLIFFLLGVTGLGDTLIRKIPVSLKAGILIGAGVSALYNEIHINAAGEAVGRVALTPVSLVTGSILSVYLLYSVSYKRWVKGNNTFARKLANYGMVPAMIIAMIIGVVVSEYQMPDIEFGITAPDFSNWFNYLPFTVGMPALSTFIIALPTAVIAYIIAFGDIVVGTTLLREADEHRPDEDIEVNVSRIHVVTAIRNLIHSFFAPYPGLAGPIWTALTATVAERYKNGRDAMESIYSGSGTFYVVAFVALFILPLVSMFQPLLPIALSLTLIVTGYVCIVVAVEQIENSTQCGVAGIVGVTLAATGPMGAAYALAIGVVLHFLIERSSLSAASSDPSSNTVRSSDSSGLETPET